MTAAPAAFAHTTVLLHEAVEALVSRDDGPCLGGTYVDGTYGRGGHSRLLLQRLNERGRVIALDRDPEAVAAATTGATRVDDQYSPPPWNHNPPICR